MTRWFITKVIGDTTSGVRNAGTTMSCPSRSMTAGSVSPSGRRVPTTRGSITHASARCTRAECLRNGPAATGEI